MLENLSYVLFGAVLFIIIRFLMGRLADKSPVSERNDRR
jgi:hypothetical protein